MRRLAFDRLSAASMFVQRWTGRPHAPPRYASVCLADEPTVVSGSAAGTGLITHRSAIAGFGSTAPVTIDLTDPAVRRTRSTVRYTAGNNVWPTVVDVQKRIRSEIVYWPDPMKTEADIGDYIRRGYGTSREIAVLTQLNLQQADVPSKLVYVSVVDGRRFINDYGVNLICINGRWRTVDTVAPYLNGLCWIRSQTFGVYGWRSRLLFGSPSFAYRCRTSKIVL